MNYIKIQKNMFKKTIRTMVSVFLLFPSLSYAETVRTNLTIPLRSFDSDPYSFEGLSLANVYVYNLNTKIKANLYKNIFLKNSLNQNVANDSVLQIGDTATLSSGPTYGDYTVEGYGSKSIGESIYHAWRQNWSHASHSMSLLTKTYTPTEDINPVVQSADKSIIDCSVNECTAMGSGTTDITVTFPSRQYEGVTSAIIDYIDPLYALLGVNSYRSFQITNKAPLVYGTNTNFGKIQFGALSIRQSSFSDNIKTMTYTFPPLTYTITVGDSIPKPIASCVSPTATQDSITINWTHTDNGAGPQSQYVVELASDASFSDRVDGGTGTTNTSHTFTDLTANTTYYARVQTKGTTEMSAWSSCGAITTTEDTQPGTFSVTCSADPSNVTIPSGSSSYTGNVRFTASPINGAFGIYRWEDIDGNLVGSNSSYTITSIVKTGNPSFSIPITVHATSTDGQTDSGTCSVTVTDAHIPPSNPPGGATPTARFYFRPDITNGNTCPLYLTATNIASCQLRNTRSGSMVWSDIAANNTINIPGTVPVLKGQYRLWCTGTAQGAVEESYGTPQTCSSNFDIKED
jgi:hypothetical protein